MRQKAHDDPPWLALGISRATWYRLGKPATKPRPRRTQAQNARDFSISVRALQRARRISRDAPDLQARIAAGELRLGTAERLLIERQKAGLRAYIRAELDKRRDMTKPVPRAGQETGDG
jgi:hypothetical protein